MSHTFKKQFGQNFLKSGRFPQILVDSLDLEEGDVVFEIGPGDGIVTSKVLEKLATIVCIEVDYDLFPKLVNRFHDQERFNIVHSDILKIDLKELADKYSKTKSIKVVGSLPYNISKQIIDKFIKFHFSTDFTVQKMAFIVQDEVAKDYVAVPPKASFLSNYLKLFASVKKLESIPASQFTPKPKVDGGILVITPKDKLEVNKDVEKIRQVMRIGFSSPRKTLRGNLKNSKAFDLESIDSAITFAKISEMIRPAELTVENWIELTNKLG